MNARFVTCLALACCLAGPLARPALADDAALREEIRLLKERLEEVEAKLSASEDAEPAAAGSPSLAKALEERFGSLSIHGSLVGYYQGGSEADIHGSRFKGENNGGFAADLELGWEPIDDGFVTLRLHAGAGDGLDRLMEGNGLLADLNTINDDNPGDQGVELLEACYAQKLFGDLLTVSVGKTQALNFIDQNAYANDEATQFVGKPLVNDPVLDAENEYGPLLALAVKPADGLELTAVVASTTRPLRTEDLDPASGADDGKDGFANVFDTPFVAAQVSYNPRLLGLDGAYRLYGWSAAYERYKLADLNDDPAAPRDTGKGWGLGLSLDQKITETVGLFARLGRHSGSVYASAWTWAAGLSADGLVPDRDKDTLGVGVAGLGSREDRLVLGSDQTYRALGGSTEYHLEAYYRVVLSENLALTPDLQYVINPLGDSDNDGVFAGMLRGEFTF